MITGQLVYVLQGEVNFQKLMSLLYFLIQKFLTLNNLSEDGI